MSIVDPGPVSHQPPGQPPASGARLPWVVAIVATLVALAAVTALVIVQNRSDSAKAERGFATPEEAVTYVAERLAAGDAAGASQAFAVRPMVDGYSFEAEVEQLRATSYQTWLPPSSSSYDEINEGLRRGAIAEQLSSMVHSILTPDRYQSVTVALSDDLTAADLVDELSPADLSELSVVRVDLLDREESGYQDPLDQTANRFGAEDLQEAAVLYDTAAGLTMGGAFLMSYEGRWYVWRLNSPLLGLGTRNGEIEPTSEKGYRDAVAQATGQY
jgi:hypothetical protein